VVCITLIGGLHADENTGTDVQNHLYNGKELDRMHGLNLYDYSARQYDPVIGQFTSMDPLCEKYYHISPYAYCAGNPIIRTDPDGRIWDTVWDACNVLYDTGAAIYNHIIGDHDTALSHWGDASVDLVAAAIPILPAGATKLFKGVDKGIDAVKTIDRGVDASKAIDKGVDATKAIDKGSEVNKMSKLQESAKTGQEAHRQIEREIAKKNPGTQIEQTIKLDSKTTVRKDAILPDGTAVIIKPNTASGIKSARKRANLMESFGYNTKTVFYDPKNPCWQPGSSTYIGPIR